MSDDEWHPSDDWADGVAKWTFILTLILTALFLAAVLIYVM